MKTGVEKLELDLRRRRVSVCLLIFAILGYVLQDMGNDVVQSKNVVAVARSLLSIPTKGYITLTNRIV